MNRTCSFVLCLVLLPAVLLLSGGPRPARAGEIDVTPSAGVENGGFALGANLRYFFVPNLAGEIDGGYGASTCQNCGLSETTLTANLVYDIHPWERISLFLVAGGGLGILSLSSPVSEEATLPLFDIGAGGTVRMGKRIGLTLENRWFLPVSGTLQGIQGGTLTASRWFLGLTTEF